MKNYKILLSTAFLIVALLSESIAQQDEKILIAAYDLEYDATSPTIMADLAPAVKQYVISAFQNSHRFQVLERTNNEAITQEIRLQKTRDYISNSMVKESEKLGAKYIVTGEINNLYVTEQDHGDLKSYAADVAFLIKIIDIEKNAVLASEQISSKAGGIVGMIRGRTNSPVAAINGALENQTKKIQKFIDKNFGKVQVGGQIVEVTERDKKKAKRVLIATASLVPVKKKNKFIVYVPTETEVAGKVKVRERQLGELKVEVVEDEEFSICQVTKGAEEILAEIDQGNTVYVKLKESGGLVKFMK